LRNGTRVRSWTRGGAGGRAASVPEQARAGAAPAYLAALQAFLPDGYPGSVTPDYLRAPLAAPGGPARTARAPASRAVSCWVPKAAMLCTFLPCTSPPVNSYSGGC